MVGEAESDGYRVKETTPKVLSHTKSGVVVKSPLSHEGETWWEQDYSDDDYDEEDNTTMGRLRNYYADAASAIEAQEPQPLTSLFIIITSAACTVPFLLGYLYTQDDGYVEPDAPAGLPDEEPNPNADWSQATDNALIFCSMRENASRCDDTLLLSSFAIAFVIVVFAWIIYFREIRQHMSEMGSHSLRNSGHFSPAMQAGPKWRSQQAALSALYVTFALCWSLAEVLGTRSVADESAKLTVAPMYALISLMFLLEHMTPLRKIAASGMILVAYGAPTIVLYAMGGGYEDVAFERLGVVGKLMINMMTMTLALVYITLIKQQARILTGEVEDQLVQLQQQQRFAEVLLNSSLPKEVWMPIVAEGVTVAAEYPDCSAMFCYVGGFEELSSLPAVRYELLNQLFCRFDSLLDLYNVEKIKSIGSNYMVGSGFYEEGLFNHAQRICRFAFRIANEVEQYNQEVVKKLVAEGGLPKAHRLYWKIGISSGKAVAGIIGHSKFQFDVFGDTVNSASRMYSSANINSIQVTEAVRTRVVGNNEFEFKPRGRTLIKGKGYMYPFWLSQTKAGKEISRQALPIEATLGEPRKSAESTAPSRVGSIPEEEEVKAARPVPLTVVFSPAGQRSQTNVTDVPAGERIPWWMKAMKVQQVSVNARAEASSSAPSRMQNLLQGSEGTTMDSRDSRGIIRRVATATRAANSILAREVASPSRQGSLYRHMDMGGTGIDWEAQSDFMSPFVAGFKFYCEATLWVFRMCCRHKASPQQDNEEEAGDRHSITAQQGGSPLRHSRKSSYTKEEALAFLEKHDPSRRKMHGSSHKPKLSVVVQRLDILPPVDDGASSSQKRCDPGVRTSRTSGVGGGDNSRTSITTTKHVVSSGVWWNGYRSAEVARQQRNQRRWKERDSTWWHVGQRAAQWIRKLRPSVMQGEIERTTTKENPPGVDPHEVKDTSDLRPSVEEGKAQSQPTQTASKKNSRKYSIKSKEIMQAPRRLPSLESLSISPFQNENAPEEGTTRYHGGEEEVDDTPHTRVEAAFRMRLLELHGWRAHVVFPLMMMLAIMTQVLFELVSSVSFVPDDNTYDEVGGSTLPNAIQNYLVLPGQVVTLALVYLHATVRTDVDERVSHRWNRHITFVFFAQTCVVAGQLAQMYLCDYRYYIPLVLTLFSLNTWPYLPHFEGVSLTTTAMAVCWGVLIADTNALMGMQVILQNFLPWVAAAVACDWDAEMVYRRRFLREYMARQRMEIAQEVGAMTEALVQKIPIPGVMLMRLKETYDPFNERSIFFDTSKTVFSAFGTILFADIKGFTMFSQTVSASKLVSILNSMFVKFDRIAEHLETVEKIKTIGDCYVCATGILMPATQNQAAQMIEMGLRMQQAMLDLNEEHGIDIAIRVGIHTGKTVAAITGRHKIAFDLFGDPVKVANEIEATGVPWHVHVSEATRIEAMGGMLRSITSHSFTSDRGHQGAGTPRGTVPKPEGVTSEESTETSVRQKNKKQDSPSPSVYGSRASHVSRTPPRTPPQHHRRSRSKGRPKSLRSMRNVRQSSALGVLHRPVLPPRASLRPSIFSDRKSSIIGRKWPEARKTSGGLSTSGSGGKIVMPQGSMSVIHRSVYDGESMVLSFVPHPKADAKGQIQVSGLGMFTTYLVKCDQLSEGIPSIQEALAGRVETSKGTTPNAKESVDLERKSLRGSTLGRPTEGSSISPIIRNRRGSLTSRRGMGALSQRASVRHRRSIEIAHVGGDRKSGKSEGQRRPWWAVSSKVILPMMARDIAFRRTGWWPPRQDQDGQ